MTMTGKGHIGGRYQLQLAFLDDDNYPMGTLTTPNSPSNATVYGAYLMESYVSVGAFTPTYNSYTYTVGERTKREVVTGVGGFGSFPLTLSTLDDTFLSYINGTSVNTSDATGWRGSNLNANQDSAPRLMLAISQQFNQDNGSDYYITHFYLNVNIRGGSPSSNAATGENPNPLEFTVTPSVSNRLPWGQLFSANSNMTAQDDTDLMYSLIANNPIQLTTYVDNAIATTYTLPYKPTSSDTGGATSLFFKEGADYSGSVSGVNTSTGVVTITAGTAADIHVALTETAFVSSS